MQFKELRPRQNAHPHRLACRHEQRIHIHVSSDVCLPAKSRMDAAVKRWQDSQAGNMFPAHLVQQVAAGRGHPLSQAGSGDGCGVGGGLGGESLGQGFRGVGYSRYLGHLIVPRPCTLPVARTHRHWHGGYTTHNPKPPCRPSSPLPVQPSRYPIST